jgi:signal transduction histidine kinase
LAVRELNPWADLSNTLAVLLMSLILSIIIWLLYCNVKQKDAAIEARNRFFSNVSHDMRTPLNAVIGFARLGQDPQRSAKEKDEHLQKDSRCW